MSQEPASVLLVDDRQENLMALTAVLEPLGLDLVTADSGEQALRHLLKQDFSVILLDVQMPGMDGFETAKQIKERTKTKDVPIIFLTALTGDPATALIGYSSGAVDYISKPFEPSALMAKVSVFVELHQKNELLKRQAAELERSNEELQQFAYIASHDLSEPLRVIRGYLDLLREDYKDSLDDAANMYITSATGSAARMQSLINDLLRYSRVGSADRTMEPADLDEILAEALENLSVSITETGADVTHGDLPTVMADRSLVVQLFQNLISNALKFRSADSPPRIEVSAVKEGDRRIVSVRDNGIGFEQAHATRLFEIFQRLHTGSEYPGTGIGLAICKKIVEQHGGRMWAESELGAGSTFSFSLPEAR
jgi:signal transduction histidine kinase